MFYFELEFSNLTTLSTFGTEVILIDILDKKSFYRHVRLTNAKENFDYHKIRHSRRFLMHAYTRLHMSSLSLS